MSVAVSAAANTTSTPGMDVTVSGLTVAVGSTITVSRSWSGQSAVVRAGADLPITGTSMLVQDFEAPFGVSVSYKVTVTKANGATSSVSSGSTKLAVTSPWISDPLSPRLACAVTLQGDALAQLDYTREGDLLATVGGSEPIAVVSPRQAASGVALNIRCLTVGNKVAVLQVLQNADPVCVRVPAGDAYSMLPPLCYVTAPTVSELPINVQYGGSLTHITWQAQLVRAPAASVVVPLRTYDDMAADASTYGDATSMWATYLDALRGS